MAFLELRLLGALSVLLLLVLLERVRMHLLKARLLTKKLLSCLVQVEHVVAEVLVAGQLEHVVIEGRHVRLDVVEEEGLHEVAAVHTDGHFLKELGNRQVLRLDALLEQVDLVSRVTAVEVEGLYGLLREAEAMERVETVVRLGDVVGDEDRVLKVLVALVELSQRLKVERQTHLNT